MALCLDALLLLAVKRRPWALVAACAWLGVLVSVHYSAIVFVLLVPFAAWAARAALSPHHLAAAALTVPYLNKKLEPSISAKETAELVRQAADRISAQLVESDSRI